MPTGPHAVSILIWERGAGGKLDVTVDARYNLTMNDPVAEVYQGRLGGGW